MTKVASRNWQDAAPEESSAGHYLGQLAPARRRRLALQVALTLAAWRAAVGFAHALKRFLDVAGALAGLVALSPVFLATAIAIRLEDRGPLFFNQERVGLRGRRFRIYKFRSMVVDAERRKAELLSRNESKAGVLFKMRRDPRITRVGAVIRKLSIDELPQLLNVLKGEMSLVGPRPAVPSEVSQYTQSDRVRLEIKPGITCLWQIGGRSEIDFRGQVKLDLEYIRERSFWLDLWIILKTVPAVVLGKGAY